MPKVGTYSTYPFLGGLGARAPCDIYLLGYINYYCRKMLTFDINKFKAYHLQYTYILPSSL